MKIFFSNGLERFQSRFDYVVDFITNHTLCSGELIRVSESSHADKIVHYGSNSEGKYKIPSQEIFFSNDKVENSSLVSNKYHFQKEHVYSVESKSIEEESFYNGSVYGFDIIECIFFHLSRYEEYHCQEEAKDQWDMMKEEDQFLVKNGLEQEPVVDRLVHSFLESLGFKIKKQKSKIRITHDIDVLKKYNSILTFLKYNASYIKNKHGLGSIKNLWASYYQSVFKSKKPFEVFEEMLVEHDIEKEIYFLVGGATEVDTPLDVNSSAFKSAVSLSKERGYKIGIHPSYATWDDANLLLEEKQRLEEAIDEPISISRQHYLHFSFEKTIEILETCGITQDSTLGYNRIIGFRAGTGEVYPLYNLGKDQVSRVNEAPLCFMDSSLFEQSTFDGKKFEELALSFLQNNKSNTTLTFNFHNSRFDDADMLDLPLKKIYNKIVNG